jgi:hypothetical protein
VTAALAAPPSVAGISSILLGRSGDRPSRDAAGELLRLVPAAVTAAYQNRRFLQSAVQFTLISTGIRQFIDIGCGHSAPGAVHETVLSMAPAARVAYIDHDPLVTTGLNSSLATYPQVAVIHGDLRQPAAILDDPVLRAHIDLTEPVAVILSSVLHHLADGDDPNGAVAILTGAMAPGSQLVLSHAAAGHAAPSALDDARSIFEGAGAPYVPRDHAAVTRFFDGVHLMAPGVISGAVWRPGYRATDPRPATFYAGVGTRL